MSSTCITSTIIAGAGQHSFNTCLWCTWYRGCRPTHQIPVQCWASPGSMPVNRLRHWASTNLSPDLVYTLRKHVAFNQYCFNVDPQSSTLARHWNSIGGLYCIFWCCIMLVTFKIPEPEKPDNRIYWTNADVMLGHRLRRLANIIPTKTL